LPFALYGCAYYGFLFADRLVAWSAGSHGRPFTFRPAYEVGLDWALLSVAPALAYLEVAVHALSERISAEGARYGLDRVNEHNRSFRAFYARRLGVVVALLAVGSAVVFGGLRLARRFASLHGVSSFFADPTTLRVYAC